MFVQNLNLLGRFCVFQKGTESKFKFSARGHQLLPLMNEKIRIYKIDKLFLLIIKDDCFTIIMRLYCEVVETRMSYKIFVHTLNDMI